MNLISISNLEFLKLIDQSTYKIFYGCDQEWFLTEWQRLSGCGPSVATNIILYLTNKGNGKGLRHNNNSKNECLLLMEEVWKYVTPTCDGISSIKMFCDLMQSYIKSKGLNSEYKYMNLPENQDERPRLVEVLGFLEGALIKDLPIAFLNLCNGAEKNLESWHWVTIISLEHNEERKEVYINILDEGLLKKIDLKLWYNTTTREGGFVYFTFLP
jgi:hypothetical protein